MYKKRRKIIAVLLVVMMMLCLWGCGNKETSGPSAQEETTVGSDSSEGATNDTEQVTLVLWGGMPIEDGIQAILDGFMETYPNIKVEYTQYTNDDAGNAKLDTALLSGEQIDVYFTYSTNKIADRVKGGMAEDMANLGADAWIQENIGTEGVFQIDGKYYSIPSCKEPTVLMLNKDVFDAAGIPIPTEWTLDEFRDIAKKLTNTEAGMYGAFPMLYSDMIPISKTVLGSNAWYSADGTASNFDDPAFVYDKMAYDLVMDGSSYPYEEILAKQITGGQWCQLFASGEVAIAIYQPWMSSTVSDLEQFPHDFQTTFAPLPVPEKGKEYYNVGSLNNFMMINSKSECKEEAWLLIQYWLTDGAGEMLSVGKMPVVKSFEDPDMAKKILMDEEGSIFDLDAFTNVVLDPDTKFICDTTTTALTEMKQIRKEEIDKLMLGEQSYDDFLQNLKKRCDEAIKSEL